MVEAHFNYAARFPSSSAQGFAQGSASQSGFNFGRSAQGSQSSSVYPRRGWALGKSFLPRVDNYHGFEL